MIRSVDPRPGAVTTAAAGPVKLFGAQLLPGSGATESGPVAPAHGAVLAIDDDGMAVACGIGAIRIGQVQPAGRPVMRAADWARGRGISPGQRLGA